MLAEAREDFSALVARYERLVAALVARTTRTRRETEDLVQDVFLEAYRKRDQLRDPSRIKGWLVQVALNRARTWGRRQRAERTALPRAARAEARAESGRLERAEERERTLAAIRTLPEASQAVVTLRYLEGRSAIEIAQTLGTTPEAVRMRLSRALADLREQLAERRTP
jgi:RNA polymerase sigma-70 factor (ECF subfamily)